MLRIPKTKALTLSEETVERRIYTVRNQRVMLDSDLAELYEVPTGTFNQAVKRNLERFPKDFMMRLTTRDVRSLRSQIVISNEGRGGRRYLPHAFTEHGIAMLSSVLNSPRAVQVNIGIIRVFMHLRNVAKTHEELLRKVEEMEKKYDNNFRIVFTAIKELVEPAFAPVTPKRRIGFQSEVKTAAV